MTCWRPHRGCEVRKPALFSTNIYLHYIRLTLLCPTLAPCPRTASRERLMADIRHAIDAESAGTALNISRLPLVSIDYFIPVYPQECAKVSR